MKKVPIAVFIVILLAIIFTIQSEDYKAEDNPNNNGLKNFCTPQSRNAEVCIQLYQPVCGFFDPEKVQCVKAPCAQTFSNSCFACMDQNVLYYVDGECFV